MPCYGANGAHVRALVEAANQRPEIAAELRLSPETVSCILKRVGLNGLSALEPAESDRSYELASPGEIVHIEDQARRINPTLILVPLRPPPSDVG